MKIKSLSNDDVGTSFAKCKLQYKMHKRKTIDVMSYGVARTSTEFTHAIQNSKRRSSNAFCSTKTVTWRTAPKTAVLLKVENGPTGSETSTHRAYSHIGIHQG